MLENAKVAAFDHGIRLLVLQKHPHHRGLGNIAADAGEQLLIPGSGEHPLSEAGAVVAVYRANPVPQLRGERERKISQVAPFGVSSQQQRAGAGGSQPGGIVQGGGLAGTTSRKLRLKSSFQPTRVLSVPRRPAGLSGVQQHGEAETAFPAPVQAVLIEREGQGGEAGSGEESLQQGKIMPAPHPVLCLLLRQGEEGLRRLLKGRTGWESGTSS